MNPLGNCSLSISASNLNFELLNRLKVVPTTVVRRGQLITTKSAAPYDIWILEVDVTEQISIDLALEKLIHPLRKAKQELNFIKNQYEVTLNCYLRSDYGQLGIQISPAVIQLIGELELGLNFHILSYSGV
ncbi:DUF4279 domain-containing protein [Paenibacillus lutrae]|uniref:DUF4279 domain-containing protein n=1 Tax=Paenibacillus lutrae TaxID=2078573 RepID=A0A7X3K0D4_9BACL|nr:DUF4279 domain-containing protein [Paenibacillus lutrae]MVP00831.1 DUF4279 domain-containing protein [Paenibacillus lutrae]